MTKETKARLLGRAEPVRKAPKEPRKLLDCWEHETNDEETQEWRDDLTEEELAYVDDLDERYTGGIAAMCSAILVRERVRARFAPEDIEELKTVYDHCVLRTRSGRRYTARLGRKGDIILEEVR